MNKTYLLSVLLITTVLLASITAHAQNREIAARIVPIITYLLEEVDNLVKAFPTGKLNDTGITRGRDLNATTFNSSCISNTILGSTEGPQDCNYGADIKPDSDADGYAGFSFTFIDDNGELQVSQNKATACAVLDNVTGLMWDSGRAEDGLKAPGATYQWFSTKSALFSFLETKGNDDTCPGYDSSNSTGLCNTEAYVDRLNAARWCGHNDWRLPNKNELLGIIMLHDGSNRDYLSTNYFFEMPTVWSSTLFLFDDFSDQTDRFIVSDVHLSQRNNSRSGQPVSLNFSSAYNQVLVVRND